MTGGTDDELRPADPAIREQSPLAPEAMGAPSPGVGPEVTEPGPGPTDAAETERPPWLRRHPVRTALLAVLGLLLLVLLVQVLTWPDVARLATENPKTTAFIERYKESERTAGRSGEVHWRWVPYERISPHLKRAVLVAEDIDFFSHKGFATDEMKKALEEAWEEKQLPRGASTLTQQLAKNLWLSPSRNPLRKVKEALLTRQLEAHLSKRRIFELYLNVAEMGPGVYGAGSAPGYWFGVSNSHLTELQAAQLAALLPRPKTWHPRHESRAYTRRVETILRRMRKADWLWKVI